MSDRHPEDDLLLDLALSDVDEQRRDSLTSHLALCEPCRTRYTALADSVDHVLAAAPRVAPPPGFSQSVMTALGIAGPQPGTSPGVGAANAAAEGRAPSTARAVRAWQRPRVWLAAVAAVAALLLGAAGAAALLRGPVTPGMTVAADGAALVTGDGARVGTVLTSRYQGRPVLIVTLTDGSVGQRYDCQLVLADGTRQSAGSWVLPQQSGTTWVLAHPDTDVTGLEVVTDTGTWATAKLPTASPSAA
ncbi:MAG TPA: hypothetical protein VF143_00230 [Candidatus Nanopelagicales bacterium]